MSETAARNNLRIAGNMIAWIKATQCRVLPGKLLETNIKYRGRPRNEFQRCLEILTQISFRPFLKA